MTRALMLARSMTLLDGMIRAGFRGRKIGIGFRPAYSAVTQATVDHDAREAEDMRHGRHWTRVVRNRISFNHDARTRDGIEDSLIRAERWHAIY